MSKYKDSNYRSQLNSFSLQIKEGSVLVTVLAVIVLLTFLVTRFLEEAIEDLEYRAISNEPPEIRSFTYSMLEVALATINEVAIIDEGKLYAPEQGWADPINYAHITVPNGLDVKIQIQDECGKLPINTMNEALMNTMFEESFDFNFSTSRELSSMLLDWIDANEKQRLNGAESEDYLRRNPPYRANNAPLQSLKELRLLEIWEDEFFDLEGRPNKRFYQLDNMVSVVNSGATNLNSSSEPVVELLALYNGFDQERLFDNLKDLPYLKAVPDSATNQNCGVEIQLLSLTVTVSRGNVPFTISALVEPKITTGLVTRNNTPGRSSSNTLKTGTISEQEAIAYPFRILEISEYSKRRSNSPPARYSALDIARENLSF